MSNSSPNDQNVLNDQDTLVLHQLRILEWLDQSARSKPKTDGATESANNTFLEIPQRWDLTKGIEPYEWQKKCIRNWFENNGRGTVKVVTGGGKTLLALAIAQELQNTKESDLYVAIVVPTIVLMHQWRDELIEKGNLPPEAIGRLGGGYDDTIGDNVRILITVLASASSRLSKAVNKADVSNRLMLIVDECHRSGSKDMSKVFETERAYSLGLSATPEREDDEDAGYDESTVGHEVGKIIYEFNLIDALREGLVPKFTINHYGLSLTKAERSKYDEYSRSISDAASTLKQKHRESRSKGDFFSWARSYAMRSSGELAGVAMRFISESSHRRELLNRMEARHLAVEKLLQQEFKLNPDARVILFHESIDEVMDLFRRLRDKGMPAIAEHSELPGSIRETGLDLFRRGIAKVIVSARSLIEGFNVPAVDVGIIVASSGSVRQRIQSLGRVLRRHRGASGEEKTSCIYVLYGADTTEENLYGKHDWDATTGVEQNRYFKWDLVSEPILQDGPPRTPLPTESEIEGASLEPGCVYPGAYEGIELSCDSHANITNENGEFLKKIDGLADQIAKVKGSAGRFKVTPKKRFVLVRIPAKDGWENRFITQLDQPLEFQNANTPQQSLDEMDQWLQSASAGSEYPFGELKPTTEYRFKRKGGGVIAQKIKDGEMYARDAEKANDTEMGSDAETLVSEILQLHANGSPINKVEINRFNHVIYRESGKLYFICRLKKGLEFPH